MFQYLFCTVFLLARLKWKLFICSIIKIRDKVKYIESVCVGTALLSLTKDKKNTIINTKNGISAMKYFNCDDVNLIVAGSL